MATMPAQRPGLSKQNYATPMDFIRATKTLLGIKRFAWDFAAEPQTAKATGYWTKDDDSLGKSLYAWRSVVGNGWGWLNPPFANITPWAEKCEELSHRGGRVALLVPASVGANWYRDHVHGKAWVLALNGRLAFIDGKPNLLYPKDCILALYGPDYDPGFEVWPWKS